MADQNFQGGSFGPPQRKPRTGIDPKLTVMAENDPEGYVQHMKNTGQEDQLEPGDHMRAAAAGFARKLKGYFGGGE